MVHIEKLFASFFSKKDGPQAGSLIKRL